jgi:hypothetical protein
MPAPLPLPTAPTTGTVAAPTAAPTVISFDEQEYKCQRGDTFEKISQRFYLGSEYAKALEQHNRQHPRASTDMANSGTLKEGERIFIPQTKYLEQYYAAAISKPAPVPASGVVPANLVQPSNTPIQSPPPLPMPVPPSQR